MARKRKPAPRKAKTPLSRTAAAAELQERGRSLAPEPGAGSRAAAPARTTAPAPTGEGAPSTGGTAPGDVPARAVPVAGGVGHAPAAPAPAASAPTAPASAAAATRRVGEGASPSVATDLHVEVDDPFEDEPAAEVRDAQPSMSAAPAEAAAPAGGIGDALDAFEEAAFEALEGAAGSGSAAEGGPDGEEGSEPASPKGRRRSAKKGAARRRAAVRVAVGVAAVVLAAAVVASAAFSWNRWLRFDDAADLQGQWAIADGQGSASIDGESIHLTDFEAYAYEADTGAKTLAFTFGDLSGSARYRFSADRTQLAIQDGAFSFTDTLADDIAWTWGQLVASLTGAQAAGPSFGEGSLVLTRIGSVEPADQSGEEPSEGSFELGDADEPADGSAADGGADAGDAASDDGASPSEEAAGEGEPDAGQAAEEALSLGGGSGVAGGNAVKPEDLL